MFSPGGTCSRAKLQALLGDHHLQLSQLASATHLAEEKHLELKRSYAWLREDHDSISRDAQDLREEVARLREEHEALRDCLAASGMLKCAVLRARLSLRRATSVLRRVLEASELSTLIGACAGVAVARRLAAVSKTHAGTVRSILPALQHKMPPDVYVIGGKNDSQPALATVERFSPSTGEWRALPQMSVPRYGCAATALGGKLYVVGGHDGRNVLASAERFDPLCSLPWESLPPMPTARSRCAAAALRGHLYVIGGRDSRQRVTAAERFDPTSQSWEPLPPMPLAPMGCCAASLSGVLYVVGVGADRDMAMECFDTQRFTWESVPSVPRQRFGCAAAATGCFLYVLGGHDGEKAVAVAERLFVTTGKGVQRPSSSSWQLLPPLPTARHGCAAVAAGGSVYVLGGDDAGDWPNTGSLAAAERFDPALGRWEDLPAVPTGRFGCAAATAWR
mmetsp:Transcript_20542/g.57044  ORF Transcript_20542/g.57044 Transcript_20542/m.57044 type:complete len:450 (-) Transcript_20542:64-1413(-)